MADKEMTNREEVDEGQKEYELTDADVDEVAREVVEPEDREDEEINEIVEQYVSPGEEQVKRIRQTVRRLEASRMQREAGASNLTSEEIEEAMEEAFESTSVDDKVFSTEQGENTKSISVGKEKKKDSKEKKKDDEDEEEEEKEERKKKTSKKAKKVKNKFKVTKSDVKSLNSSRMAYGSVGSLVRSSQRSGLLVADRGPGDVGGPIYVRDEGPQAGFVTYPHTAQRPFEIEPREEVRLKTQSNSGSKIELGARITPPTLSTKPKSKPPTLLAGRGKIGTLMARGGLGAGFASLIPKTTTASKKRSKKKAKITRKGRGNSKKSTKKMKSKTKMKKKTRGSLFSGSLPFKV